MTPRGIRQGLGAVRQVRILYLIAIVAIVVVSLVLRATIPIVAWANESFDDGLFVRLASSLASGRWLGAFDELTLAKGPAYPALIAFTTTFHLPLKLAEQAVLLCAAGATGYVIGRLSRSREAGLTTFGVLALDPTFLTDHHARVIRDGFYVAVSLLFVAALAWLLLVNRAIPSRWQTASAAGLVVGVVGATFWLTREEGLWLAPSVGIIVLAFAWRISRSRTTRTVAPDGGTPDSLPSGSSVLRRVSPLAGAAAGFAFCLGVVTIINYALYGALLTNDFRDGGMPAAYGALARIEPDEWERYVVIPSEARTKAYEVSAAMAELRPWLEGDHLRPWIEASCNARRVALDPGLLPPTCDDVYAGWFTWAMRRAIRTTGNWSTGTDSQLFLERIAAEVNAACSDGRISCGPARSSMEPPFRSQYVEEVVRLLPIAFDRLVQGGAIGNLESRGDTVSLLHFANVLDGALAPPAEEVSVQGAQIPPELVDVTSPRSATSVALGRSLQSAYAAILPFITLLGAIGVSVALVMPSVRRRYSRLLVVAIACVTAVVVRLSLIAYLEVSSWPGALNGTYLAAASPFLITFCIAGIVLLVGCIRAGLYLLQERVDRRST